MKREIIKDSLKERSDSKIVGWSLLGAVSIIIELIFLIGNWHLVPFTLTLQVSLLEEKMPDS